MPKMCISVTIGPVNLPLLLLPGINCGWLWLALCDSLQAAGFRDKASPSVCVFSPLGDPIYQPSLLIFLFGDVTQHV